MRSIFASCVFCGLVVAGPVVAGADPCAVLIVGSDEQPRVLSVEDAPEIREHLKTCCEPGTGEDLDLVLDGGLSDKADLGKARLTLQKARDAFINVEFALAEKLARHAVKLFRLNHVALLDQREYVELIQAYLFLGQVLHKRNKRAGAQKAFKNALRIDPKFKPDPRTFPPDARQVFERVASEAMSGPRGALTLKTGGTQAEVYLDGRAGGHTPLRIKNLLPGGHFVVLKHPQRLPWEGVIRVQSGQTVDHDISLKSSLRQRLAAASSEQLEPVLAAIARKSSVTRAVVIQVKQGSNPADWQVVQYSAAASPRMRMSSLANLCQPVDNSQAIVLGKTQEPSAGKDDHLALQPPIQIPEQPSEVGTSVFTSWWFWTAVGMLAAGAVTTVVVLSSPTENPLRVTIEGLPGP